MNNTAASSIEKVPEWQLLAQFVVTGQPDSNGQLLNQVMDSVRGLNLQPAQLERIQQAFVPAVARAIRSGKPGAVYRLRIRIWLLGDGSSGRGLGFFLLEKQGDYPECIPAAEKTERHLELLLYRERDC